MRASADLPGLRSGLCDQIVSACLPEHEVPHLLFLNYEAASHERLWSDFTKGE